MELDQLRAEVERRKAYYSSWNLMATEIVDARNGKLPARFNDYFPDELHRHDLNQLRLAHDDLTSICTFTFPIDVRPKNNSDVKEREAARVENVLNSYRDSGNLPHELLKKQLAFWLTLVGDAVAIVMPDYERKSPYYHFRDPRHHLPPIGWGPWSPAPLDGTMFVYNESLAVLKMRYPDKAMTLENAFNKQSNGIQRSPNVVVEVVEYYSRDSWQVVALGEPSVPLVRSDQGDRGHPGVCPVHSFTMYDGDNPKGRPPLSDLISLQAAASRMLSQEIDYSDAILFPILAHTPMEGGKPIQRGFGAANVYDTTNMVPPRIDKVAPDSPINALNTINFLMEYARTQSRNPESFQGIGQADSAKALSALKAGVEGYAQTEFINLFANGEPKLYGLGMEMDRNIWGNVKKDIAVNRRGSVITESYVPNLLLKGYENQVRLKRPMGAGGYQGVIERMQLVGSKLMSKRDFFEQDYRIDDPLSWEQRIELENLKEMAYADFSTKAQQGMFAPDAFSKIRKLMTEKNIDWMEAAEELQASGELMPPPPPTSPDMGGAPPPPGLEALLGGGQDPFAQGGVEGLPAPGDLRAAI